MFEIGLLPQPVLELDPVQRAVHGRAGIDADCLDLHASRDGDGPTLEDADEVAWKIGVIDPKRGTPLRVFQQRGIIDNDLKRMPFGVGRKKIDWLLGCGINALDVDPNLVKALTRVRSLLKHHPQSTMVLTSSHINTSASIVCPFSSTLSTDGM